MVLDGAMKLNIYVVPFPEGSNKVILWSLISRVSGHRFRAEMGVQPHSLRSENEERGTGNRQKVSTKENSRTRGVCFGSPDA
jgi:hypothetical protein